MSSKEHILSSIKKNLPSFIIDLPKTNIPHTTYANKNTKFKNSLANAGGDAIWLKDESIDEFVDKNYPNLAVIVSTCKELTCTSRDPNKPNTPHALDSVDLAIIEADFAVAENGAVWVKNSHNRHRALYFLAKQLLIIIKKDNIVDTMHEAYERVEFEKAGYGLFISGPSKTADIEQSLVIGAHGPVDACVLFV